MNLDYYFYEARYKFVIDLYALKVPSYIDENVYQLIMSKISVNSRDKVNQYVNRKDGYPTILAEILVRSIIYNKYGLTNDYIEYNFSKHNKPFIGNLKDFHFNISHSEDWVILATSRFQIGVDIEKIRTINFKISNRFFTNSEHSDLMSTPINRQLAFFFELWTLKESYLKAIGKGLLIPLNSFEVRQNQDSKFQLFVQGKRNFIWSLKKIDFENSYKLAICSREKHFTNKVKHINISDII